MELNTTESQSLTSAEKTTASNYFIANYPPFSFWSPDRVGEALSALERPPDPATPLGMYLHIPFCRRRCHFCYFRVYTGKNSTEIRDYIDLLVRELELYASRSFIGDRDLDFIYFGGGTPSYLSTRELRSLTERLSSILPWKQAEEITFECEPGTLTESKLQVIHDLGITRLSLGVENFDDHILEINGRAHRSKEIWRAYEFAKSLGFPQLNIDLIAGMVGETDENWQDCVDKSLSLEPDSVTIYQMEVPYNTTIYKNMKDEGNQVAPVADWPTKRRWVDFAFSQLEKAGYHVGSAYTAVKDPAKSRFIYRDQLWSGADMIALGVSSFSHIGGTHFQNEHDIGPYMARIKRGELPIHRALTPTQEEGLIRELILQLKLGQVRRDYFQEKFQSDILERFSTPLRRLQESGDIRVSNGTVLLTRQGLLQVDRLLPEFFLPEHRNARYA